MMDWINRIPPSGLGAEEKLFFAVLLLNALLVLVYAIVNMLHEREQRRSFVLRCIVMLLCPVVGPCFFFFSWLCFRLFLRTPVDLADVIFSKQRVRTYLKADETKESNYVPLEEALTVTDKNNTRMLMMEVVRRDISSSLATIALGLNSEDNEVSHYAATVLQESMDKLRIDFRRYRREIMALEDQLSAQEQDGQILRTPAGESAAAQTEGLDDADVPDFDATPELQDVEFYREENIRERTEREALEQGKAAQRTQRDEQISKDTQELLEQEINAARKLMKDLARVLRQKVFASHEQSDFSVMLEEMAEIVNRRDRLTAYELEGVALLLLDNGDYERCEYWCRRSAALYPNSLSTYTARLKLAFARGERETFFSLLEELKKTDITLDHETLELVRAFSAPSGQK